MKIFAKTLIKSNNTLCAPDKQTNEKQSNVSKIQASEMAITTLSGFMPYVCTMREYSFADHSNLVYHQTIQYTHR